MPSVQESFESLISLAIQREIEAYEFYTKAAEKAEFKSSAQLLHELAKQEQTHQTKLKEALDSGICKTFDCSVTQVESLNLDKYLSDVPLRPDSPPQDILIVAIKREELSHNFYKSLSALTGDAEHRVVFETLAKEEQYHKDRLERLYDKIYQPDM